MYREYRDMTEDDDKMIMEEFDTSMDTKVRCMECEWHGVIKDTKIETTDGEIDGLVCPECFGFIEDE